MTFIKELDGSGFIDRLYKKPAVALASREKPRSRRRSNREKTLPGSDKNQTDHTDGKVGRRHQFSRWSARIYRGAGRYPKQYRAQVLRQPVQMGKDIPSESAGHEEPRLYIRRAKNCYSVLGLRCCLGKVITERHRDRIKIGSIKNRKEENDVRGV